MGQHVDLPRISRLKIGNEVDKRKEAFEVGKRKAARRGDCVYSYLFMFNQFTL